MHKEVSTHTMPNQNKFEVLIYGSIMAILASLVTALLSDEKNNWTVIKTFLAGALAGILLHFIFLDFNFSQGVKDVVATTVAAFISSIWPRLGVLANKYIKKKGDELVQNNKPD